MDDDGDVKMLASTDVRITPDIDIECEEGEEITPGDPSHPNGGAQIGLERIELDRVSGTRSGSVS